MMTPCQVTAPFRALLVLPLPWISFVFATGRLRFFRGVNNRDGSQSFGGQMEYNTPRRSDRLTKIRSKTEYGLVTETSKFSMGAAGPLRLRGEKARSGRGLTPCRTGIRDRTGWTSQTNLPLRDKSRREKRKLQVFLHWPYCSFLVL